MTSTPLSPAPRITRIELFLVIAISLAGFALRAAYPSRLAVEHFDEGVYASNIWFGQADDYRYPNQHLYAPPLLPTLIELVFTFFGPSNAGAMAVNIVAGSLTIPLLWWVGRCWFGPSAGLAAMALCAFSDIHIFFSRTALTDVLLCFFLVGAVYLIWEALTSPTPLRLFAAGLVTALAWWTKYSGWLPLAISGAGVMLWMIASLRQQRASVALPLDGGVLGGGGRWAIIAAIAFALWAPHLWSLQDKGGYAAVAANHQGYVVGWTGWIESARVQCKNLVHLDSWLGCGSLVLALFLVAFARTVPNLKDWLLTSNLCLYVASLILLPFKIWNSAIPLLCSSFGPLESSMRELVRRRSTAPATTGLSLAMFAAWTLALLVVTPLYHPFPRLLLPAMIPAWLGTGWFLSQGNVPTGNNLTERKWAELKIQRVLYIGMTALLLVVFRPGFRNLGDVPGWHSRTGLAELAQPIITDACHHAGLDPQADSNKLWIDTYGEPALLFQLGLAGVEKLFPVSHLGFARPDAPLVDLPAFVVIGSHARQSAEFDRQFAESKARLELVAEYKYHPSDLVLLDNREPERRPQPGRRRPVEKLELYRIR